jgi:glycogen phosphorylase
MKTEQLSFPSLPYRIRRLADVACNLWFSWHSHALWLFQSLDPKLWDDVSHNPVRLLFEIDSQRLEEVTADPEYIKQYDTVISAFDHYMSDKETWFTRQYPKLQNRLIAYFSMEFGIHECLPIYSGGLGMLAGDHLKSASDLGLPLIGMSLLYRESYFTQFITAQGEQQVLFIHNTYSDLPVMPVKDENGEQRIVRVNMDHRSLAARLWQSQVGRVKLFLMDTDFQENTTENRKITQRLYVGDRDLRLLQEILLGIGGVIAIRSMGLKPDVYHMNEGHCAFLGIERIADLMAGGETFEKARQKVKASTVFTTHTPVPAGNEVFNTGRVETYLNSYLEAKRIPVESFFDLVRCGVDQDPNAFNMTALSLRLADHSNAVSQIHGEVSRLMWHGAWPDRTLEEVPITAITNGIHTRTWMSSWFKNMLDAHLKPKWRYELTNPKFWEAITKIPDEIIWRAHQELKQILILEIRKRLVSQRERNGESREAIAEAETLLNPKWLTMGVARRVALYKRATLLFTNRDWLKSLVGRDDRPIQIIFAGKAHPADQPGRALIREIYSESRNPDYKGRIVFVENYDMSFARRLVSGVDVWLNTPRRTMEASGTSGMKVAVNGGLNLSVLDGWWCEGYNGRNGWPVGEDKKYYNESEENNADAYAIYRILEDQIMPMFYERDPKDLPKRWIEMMKESMKSIIPQYNTNRMIIEYMTQMYEPALAALVKPTKKR